MVTNTASLRTEKLFLRFFKAVIIIFMASALVITALALIASPYFFMQSPKEPLPAKPAPTTAVNGDEFLRLLDATKADKKVEEEKRAGDRTEPVKYTEEATKIIGCLQQANEKAGIEPRQFSSEVVDSFRRDLQRVADDANVNRGQPYVTDAVRVVCGVLLSEKLVEMRKKNNDLRVFIPAVNFHMRSWDQLRSDARKYEQDERSRVAAEERAEELRVAAAQERGRMLLLGAAAAFGLFLAIALYLIISAMESNLRRIGEGIEALVGTGQSARATSPAA